MSKAAVVLYTSQPGISRQIQMLERELGVELLFRRRNKTLGFTEIGKLILEARSHRLYPGEGSLPLRELLDALPPGIPLSVEAPTSHHAHLSSVRRAQAAACFRVTCHLENTGG